MVQKNLVNDAPVFQNDEGEDATTATRSVPENSPAGTAVGAPVTAYDDDGDVLTYTLSGTDASSFTIDRQTAQIRVKAGTMLNRETKASYTVTVTAKDPSDTDENTSRDTINVTINVTNVEEAPEITDGDTLIDYAENTATTTAVDTYTATDDDEENNNLKWSLSGVDSDKFSLCQDETAACPNPDNSGNSVLLRFNEQPNYEAATDSGKNNTYQLTITVTDSKGMTASRNVTVTVTNVDEAGTVTLSRVQQQVGHSVTATLTDPDGSTSGVKWKWGTSVSETWQGTDQFIAGQTSSSYRPVAADVGKYLYAFASYTDPQGSGKTATSTQKSGYTVKAQNTYIRCTRKDSDDTCTATSTSANNGNMTPVFYDQDRSTTGTQNKETTVSVEENTAPGIVITGLLSNDHNAVSGANPPAVDNQNITGGDHLGDNTDTATVDRLTYTLEGTDRSKFTVERHTGQLKTKAALDYENPTDSGRNNTYDVTIKAYDPSNKSASLKVKINVTNTVEAPVITGGAATISTPENTATSTVQSTYTATDDEDDKANKALTWSLSSEGDDDDFTIGSANGQLKFKSSPNYEVPADDGTNNVYNVTVIVTDSAGGTAMRSVTITVTNVDETGAVMLSTLQPKEGVQLTATLTDPDSVTNDNTTGAITADVTWQWATSTSKNGPWTDIDRSDARSSSYTRLPLPTWAPTCERWRNIPTDRVRIRPNPRYQPTRCSRWTTLTPPQCSRTTRATTPPPRQGAWPKTRPPEPSWASPWPRPILDGTADKRH